MSTVEEIESAIGTLPEAQRRILIEKLLDSPPDAQRRFKTWIGASEVTGLPVLKVEAGAPKITNDQVKALLADFP